MKKKIFVLLMIICMMCTFMPTFAFATDGAADTAAEVQTESVKTDEVKAEEAPAEATSETEGEVAKEAKEENAGKNGAAEELEAEKVDSEEHAEENSAPEGETTEPAIAPEAVPAEIEEPTTEDIAFKATKSDYLGYDPLYIAKYADPRYVDVSSMDMSCFYDLPAAAKGIATYNVKKQADFDVTEKNFIAGLTYEMPVYDVDKDSKYYVCIPNVNLFNDNFKAYDLCVGYNNDYAELITGWKYSKGILYIPKSAVDKPKNEKAVPEGTLLAVQLNYAIGGDMDFSKSIPVQVLDGKEPVDKTVHTSNIFDRDNLIVNTGVKGRKASDVSVYLNGNLIPINETAWQYDGSTGDVSIQMAPGVVSNINIIFEPRNLKEKVQDAAVGALEAITTTAYAATSMDEMSFFKTDDGTPIKLDINTGDIFVGWRGHFRGKYIHGNSEAKQSQRLSKPGYKNSVKYLYGGYTTSTGSSESSNVLAPAWAIGSYAIAYNMDNNSSQGALEKDTMVTHRNTISGGTETKTIYEWMLTYRDRLEKSLIEYGAGHSNGIGGTNNFAFTLPKVVKGASTSLVSSGENAGKANKTIRFMSDEITAEQGPNSTNVYYDYWIAAGCNHLDMAEDADLDAKDNDIYVTCLGLGSDYAVLAFVQSNGGSYTQNACGIYKFKFTPRGYLKIKKTQKQTGTDFVAEAPNNYSLAGAQYQLYTDRACTAPATDANGNNAKLTTDANGDTATLEMSPGTYYAKELVASKGFKLDEEVKPITLTADNTENNPGTITSVEEPATGKPNLTIYKVDETGKYGWSKLLGAEYTISYYDVTSKGQIASASPKRQWKFATKKKGTGRGGIYYAGIEWDVDDLLSGSSDFYLKDGQRVIPCGWFVIEETAAPSGLSLSETKHYGQVAQTSNGAEADTNIEGADKDGELRIQVFTPEEPQAVKIVVDKNNARTGENAATESETEHSDSRKGKYSTLAGAKYEVYYDDNDLGTPELVGIITTDENGHGELATRELGDERFVGEKLSLGNYIVREISPAPGFVLDKYQLADGVQKESSEKTIEVICDYSKDGTPVTKTISGNFAAGDHAFRTRAESDGVNVFTYTVASNDEPTRVPISKTDITTGEELPGALLQVIDSEGTVVEEWTSTNEKHVINELPVGTYTLREITAPYGYDVAEDVNFEVKENTIVTPVEMKNKPVTVGTTATDIETGTHQGTIKEESQIEDVVKITGLYEGRTYQVKGRLMDKETGEALTDAEGNEIVGTLDSVEGGTVKEGGDNEFVAGGDVVDATLIFTVDSSEFTKDTTTVAFEKLYRTTKVHEVDADVVPIELQKHEDINDDDQTIHYGGIVKTTAVDKDSKSHNLLAAKNVTIVDTVEYKNLSTKETYTLSGELYDKTTGQLTGIKATKNFTPKTVDGTVDVEFTFDATPYENHDLVVFETLKIVTKKGSVEIDKHEDPDDENQTVHVPEIRTNATDVKTGDHIAMAEKTVSIKDIVTYKNLIPGKTYTMEGTLMNKATGKPIQVEGKNVTASQTFTPTEKDGTVEIVFTFNGVDLAGTKTVVFEECKINKEPVAVHADIKDPAQTIDIPKIGTKVGKVKGKKVEDTVTYKNLIPGRTNVMRGWLVKKSNGKKISGSEGEFEFTPTSSSGKVKVTLYTDNMKSDAVAFEECYMKTDLNGTPAEVKVGEHKDLKDRKQTIRMTAKGPKTGDGSSVLYGLVGILTAALATILKQIRRRNA